MKFVFIALVMFITGCTTIPGPDPGSIQGSNPAVWEIKGRLAARIDQQGGSASFIWQRQNENHSIELYGPLGSGRIFLKQTQGKASLIDNSSEFFGDNLEDVLFQRVGWLIPFDNLQQWIIGRPQLDDIADRAYENSSLIGFSQSGWQVSYDKFGDFSGVSIPTKITLTALEPYIEQLSENAGRPIDNARVKIVITKYIGQ